MSYSKAQIESVLRTAITNITVNQDSLRRLPILTEDPTADHMICALNTMDAAKYNLGLYAAKAGIALREGMPT